MHEHAKWVRNLAVGCSVAAALILTLGATAVAKKPHRRHGYIVGTAKSECGKPLSKFVVKAYGFTGREPNEFPMGSPPLGQAKGHHGHYALRTVDSLSHKPANALVDSVEATAPVRYQGHTYTLPLYPTDGKRQFTGHSGKGIIRNFVLRTSGTKPGESQYRNDLTVGVGDPAEAQFYGGNVLAFLNLGDVTGQTLTFNFKPLTRKLADGCKAKPFSRSITLGQFQGNDNFMFQSIPLAFYQLTASVNGRTVLLALDGQATTTPSVPFQPLPDSMFGDGSDAVHVYASFTSSPYGQ